MEKLADHDKRMYERAEKDRKGVTTVGNLYCEDQLCLSDRGKDNFDRIAWKKGGCQKATCELWNTPLCPETTDPGFDFDSCGCWKE